MNTDKWIDIWKKSKKGLGVILGILIWVKGFEFSVNGFESFLGIPSEDWMGELLGIIVTWLQINLNEGFNKHPTLYVSGILSYLYGFATNWMGLFLFQTAFFSDGIFVAFSHSPIETLIRIMLTIIIGIFMDVLPEHMITFGLFGESYAGDLLRSLSTGLQEFHSKPQKKQKQNVLVPQRTKPVDPMFHRIDWKKLSTKHRQILSYAMSVYSRTNKLPGPTEVSKKLFGNSNHKGTVSSLYKKYQLTNK